MLHFENLKMAPVEKLVEARQKVLELEREKQRIDEQLQAWIKIRDGYESLSKVANTEPLPTKISATEAILVILGKHPQGLTPREIRGELQTHGVSIGSDKNFLGNIHTIIKRHPQIETVPGRKGVYRLTPKS
jgi:hypothetical protein